MPGDTRTHVARQAKKKRRRARKVGSLKDAQKAAWQALDMARQILLCPDSDDDKRLKAAHAVNQLAMGYAKLLEVGELEARLAEVETALASQKNGAHTLYQTAN